ncbi:MAG: glycosyl hydrolase [Reichenbachiella sp.]
MLQNLHKQLSLFLSFVIIGLFMNSPISAQVVSVGSGSYTTTFPGTDAAGRNQFPSGTPGLTGVAATKPVPTNDWWSDLIKTGHGGNAYNYPLSFVSKSSGLVINYTVPNTSPIEYRQPIGDAQAIVVGTDGLNATESNASDHSDWGVTMDWSNQFEATINIGSPFVYFEKNTTAAAKVAVNFNAEGVSVDGNKLIITGNMNNSNYVVFGPAGSTWSGSGGIYTSTLNGNNYWSIAMLPDGADVNSSIAQLEQYAYVFPGNTAVDWDYNESTGKVRTTFTVTPDVKEGVNNQVLQGLLPHQWSRLASGSTSGMTYSTVRGELRMMGSNSFIVENTFSGILPTLPDLGKYSDGFDPGALAGKIAQLKNDGLAEWTDSYNEGQVMNRLIQAARIADQMGDIETRDVLVSTVQTRLEDWFTVEGGEVAFLFYYNDDWDALIGYPAGHSQDANLNDHHFHWGYFIHAAAAIEQFNPGWASQWGDMVDLLIRDAANPSRDDSMFPFLRNFSPYAGHSWANGFATVPFGNDQESTSESMQFNSALIHWGTLTNNDEIRDLGIYLYTTEESTVQEYWFDTEERNFQPEYQYNMVARVWSGGYDNGTWWTTDLAASYGIQMYPIHGGSFYLSHHQEYLQRVWTEITQNTDVLNNIPNDNLWYDTYWKFLSFLDPQEAVNLYNAYPERNLKFGVSDAQTYHWLHGMNAMGKVKNEVTANYPITAAFEQNGAMTYVAHNYGNSPITVNFSDGYNLSVPANSMATNRDIDVDIAFAIDQSEVDADGNVNMTASVTGSGVSKVEFYVGDQLVGTDTSAPYGANSGSLSPGFLNLYAKAYVGSNLNVSNVIALQVGAQEAFSGIPSAVPGVIEAAHYDTFEGGRGQNVAYSDNDAFNQGDFRGDEGVDASAHQTEGATVGWIDPGEWLEYTINVAQAGSYQVTMRYASGSSTGGGPFWFEREGTKISEDINVAFTGTEWSTWNDVVAPNVNLTAGEQVIRLQVGGGGFNLGKMTFALVGTGDPELTTITVSPETNNLQLGGTQQYTAAGLDQFGADFAITPVWAVDGGSISGSGLFTGSALGDFTVSVTSGTVTGTVDVTVLDSTPILTSIALSPSSTSVSINATKQFTAQALDQFGAEFATTLSWSATCGSVDGSGIYTASSTTGNCEVTVSSGATSITAIVQVTEEGGAIGDVLWEDNFNTLNAEQWNPNTGDGCDIGLCGWGNQELEYYSPNNVYIESIAGEAGNNALVLEAKSESMGSSSFTSGKVDTEGRVSIQYGLIEVRMKVPDLATGLWPAAWLLGDANLAWPAKGEIDMMEMGHAATERERQGYPGVTENDYVGGNAIWAAPDGSVASIAWDTEYNKPYIADQPLNDRYVTYRLYWEPTQMRFAVVDNGTEYDLYEDVLPLDANGELNAFNKPFYMLLNLAVGGNFTDATTPGQVTAPRPAKMYVDYVRVSQYNGHGTVTLSDGELAAETGIFGVYTETALVNNELNFGTDADIFVWGGTMQEGTTAPIEGTEVIAWETTTANSWFGGGITSLFGRNMSNFEANGSLKFKIKIPSDVAFRIGVTDNFTNEQYVTFPAGQTTYGLVRDGEWGQVEIPLVDLGGLIAFKDVNYMLAFASVDGAFPSSTFQMAIDDVVWSDGNTTGTPVLTNIVVSPSNPTIDEGDTQQFTAAGFDQFGASFAVSPTWTEVGDGSIDNVGLYTGTAAGTFTVTATDGGVSGTASITVDAVVVDPVLTTITVSPSNATIDEGATQQYTAAGFDQFGASFAITPSWTEVGDGSIDNTGLYTGTVAGTFTVTATQEGISGTADVTVNAVIEPPVLTTIEISPLNASIDVGATQQFTAQGKDQFDANIGASFNWSASGGSINGSGLFTGSNDGNFIVTVESNGISSDANITVNAASAGWALPGIVEAEDFNAGGEGIGYHDLSAGNTGGSFRTGEDVDIEATSDSQDGLHNVGWIDAGEWLEYDINATASSNLYDLSLRVASPSGSGQLHIEIDGVDVTGLLSVPNTGGWQNYATVIASDVNIASGNHTMRVMFDASGLNLNFVEGSEASAPVPVLTTITVTPSNATIDKGETQQFTAAGFDQFGASFAIAPSWTEAGGGSIDSDGLYTGSAVGSFAVTVSQDGISGSANVIVNAVVEPPVLTTIDLSPLNATIDEGATQQFTAQGKDQFGADIAVSINWSTTGGNINGSGLYTGSSTGSFVVTAESNGVSSNANVSVDAVSTGWALPGRVEAENFNGGGEGIGYHDLSAGNTGGAFRTDEDVDIESTSDSQGGLYNIGWIDAGEWLEYDISATASSNLYDLSLRVASPSGSGQLHIEIDGVDVTGVLSVPNTGGWQNFTTIVASDVNISSGNHTMRVVIDASGLNLNFVDGSEASAPVPVLAAIVVSPSNATIDQGETQQFTAAGFDQFGASFAISPSWTETGAGSISNSGLYTGSDAGSFTVTASQGGVSGNASITVNAVSSGCDILAATGDFTTEISSDTSNPTMTFVPEVSGVGDNLVILYYATSTNGPWPGYIVSPGEAFQITASTGQTIHYYYTYSLPTGGENNTVNNKDSFVVGACNSSARFIEEGMGGEGSELITIDIYPNPADHMLNVKSLGMEISSFTIFDLTGQVVMSQSNFDRVHELNIQLSELRAGQYLLQIQDADQLETLRFIKR